MNNQQFESKDTTKKVYVNRRAKYRQSQHDTSPFSTHRRLFKGKQKEPLALGRVLQRLDDRIKLLVRALHRTGSRKHAVENRRETDAAHGENPFDHLVLVDTTHVLVRVEFRSGASHGRFQVGGPSVLAIERVHDRSPSEWASWEDFVAVAVATLTRKARNLDHLRVKITVVGHQRVFIAGDEAERLLIRGESVERQGLEDQTFGLVPQRGSARAKLASITELASWVRVTIGGATRPSRLDITRPPTANSFLNDETNVRIVARATKRLFELLVGGRGGVVVHVAEFLVEDARVPDGVEAKRDIRGDEANEEVGGLTWTHVPRSERERGYRPCPCRSSEAVGEGHRQSERGSEAGCPCRRYSNDSAHESPDDAFDSHGIVANLSGHVHDGGNDIDLFVAPALLAK